MQRFKHNTINSMKKLFFGLIATVMFSVGASANSNASVKKVTNQTTTFNKACGVCHIEITYKDSRGNSHTDVWDLPCNSAAACKQMLADTLAAY